MVLVQTFDVQFYRYETYRSHALTGHRILHRKGWVWHEAIGTIEVIEALLVLIRDILVYNGQ